MNLHFFLHATDSRLPRYSFTNLTFESKESWWRRFQSLENRFLVCVLCFSNQSFVFTFKQHLSFRSFKVLSFIALFSGSTDLNKSKFSNFNFWATKHFLSFFIDGVSKGHYKHNLSVTYYGGGGDKRRRRRDAKKRDFCHDYWVSDDTQFVKHTLGNA